MPTDTHIPTPTVQLDSPVRLAANEVENLVNGLTFVGASALVSLATLPAPIVAAIAGTSPDLANALLSIGALVAAGPLIGGAGATGAALQDVVDAVGSGDIAGLVGSLISAPMTVFDGVVNGETGPNLGPLIPIIPSFLAVFTGGLLNPGGLDLAKGLILPGLIPALGLVASLLGGQLGAADMLSPLAEESESVETLSIETTTAGGDLVRGKGGDGAVAFAGDLGGDDAGGGQRNSGGGVVTGPGGDGTAALAGDLDGDNGDDTNTADDTNGEIDADNDDATNTNGDVNNDNADNGDNGNADGNTGDDNTNTDNGDGGES